MYESINNVNNKGYAAIHITAIKGDVKMMNLLLRNGGDILLKDFNMETPLRHALRHNKSSIIEEILNNKYWKEAVESGSDAESSETATESLIRDFPNLFEIVMDNSCTADKGSLQKKNLPNLGHCPKD